MRKKWARALSVVLSASMVLSMSPMSAFAQTTEASGGKKYTFDSKGYLK